MGLIQELADLVSKLNFVVIVHEYEQGLYFRKGKAIEKAVRWMKPQELAELRAEEEKLENKLGWARYFPWSGYDKLPQGFRKNWRGHILHSKRFSKVLRPGIYFHLPFLEHIVTDSRQERVLNLGYISVLTRDTESASKAVIISCNLRYEIMDFYRAYTAIYNYEASLRYHTMSILAMKSQGRSFNEWKLPETISALEKHVIDELRKIVTEKWGLKVHQLYITDVTDAKIHKFIGADVGQVIHFSGSDSAADTF